MLILGFLNTGLDSDCSWKQDRYLATATAQNSIPYPWDSKVPSEKNKSQWQGKPRVEEEEPAPYAF